MKRIIVFYILIPFVYAVSCTSDKGREVPEEYLSGAVMKTGDIIGFSLEDVTDTSLVMKTMAEDSFMAVYEVCGDTVSLRHEFAKKGRGPHEFISITSKMRDGSVMDIMNSGSYGDLMTMQMIDLNDLGTEKSASDLWQSEDLSWMENFYFGGDFVRKDDGSYYFLGDKFGTENLISRVNIRMGKYESLDYWIEDKYEGPVLPKQSVYLVNAHLYLNGDKLLYVCGENRYAEILTISSDEIVARNIIYGDCPIYSAAPDGLNYRILAGNHRGIRSCVTDKYIYLRPDVSDERMRSYKGYPWYYNDEIYVFDWDGNLQKKYITDTPFHTLKVTDDDRFLYTITKDIETEEPIIMRYEI